MTTGERLPLINNDNQVNNSNQNIENSHSIVIADRNYCDNEIDIPNCNELVDFQYSCSYNHIIKNIQCYEAFQWANINHKNIRPKCNQMIDIKHPCCQHDINIPCWINDSIIDWLQQQSIQYPIFNSIIDNIETDTNAINNSNNNQNNQITMIDSIDEGYEFNSYPNHIENYLQCNNNIILIRNCNHKIKLKCYEIFQTKIHLTKLCNINIINYCINCNNERIITCHQNTSEINSGNITACRNKINKICTICNINKSNVYCYKTNIECQTEVTSILSKCGHSVSWFCGSENDPRTDENYHCRGCNLPLWNEIITYQPKINDFYIIIDQLLSKIQNNILFSLNVNVIEQSMISITNEIIQKHINIRMQMLTILQTMYQSDTSINTPPPKSAPGTIDDINSYELVCCRLNPTQKSNNYFQLIPTNYGLGIIASNFNRETIECYNSDKNGNIEVIIGMAHTNRTHYDTLPFYTHNNSHNKHKNDENQNIANRMAIDRRKLGYDRIKQSEKKNINNYVYWHTNVIIPLMKIQLKINYPCQLCQNMILKEDGCLCSNNHLICYHTCFTNYIDNANIETNVDTVGNLICPICTNLSTTITTTTTSYDIKQFINHTDIFTKILQLQMNYRENEIVKYMKAKETNSLGNWNTKISEKITVTTNVIKYVISFDKLTTIVCRESTEFNNACAQFSRLLPRNQFHIKKVEVIEYDDKHAVVQNFKRMKAEFLKKSTDEEHWVFHGSNQITDILKLGFKVSYIKTIRVSL